MLRLLFKSTKTIKRTSSPPENTPESKRFHPTQQTFSPVSYSPLVSSQSVNYANRTNSGVPVLSYGPDNVLSKAIYKRNSDYLVTIKQWGNQDSWLPLDYKYMYEVLSRKSCCLNNITERLGRLLIKQYDLDTSEQFAKHSLRDVTAYGRVCCDANGRLNPSSVLLEGTYNENRGAYIPLNLKKLKKYALFPGQVVATRGFIINNDFIVENLFTDVMAPFSQEALVLKEVTQIVAAAGPFSLNDNLAYEPLQDLLKYVISHKPHILLLIGPFLDASHVNVSDGTMAETYDSFFESLVESIMTPLKDFSIQVVMVASPKDAHHHVVYPTLPYNLKHNYENLHFMPDPAILNMDGLILGATSVDVLLHLSKEEIYSLQIEDRFVRYASHILKQRCFYPLYPPDEEMCIDHEMLDKFGTLKVTPHIMILPSSFRYFIKNINGCLVINPERVTKGFVGGTFTRIEIHPTNSGYLQDGIACQVIKI